VSVLFRGLDEARRCIDEKESNSAGTLTKSGTSVRKLTAPRLTDFVIWAILRSRSHTDRGFAILAEIRLCAGYARHEELVRVRDEACRAFP
jgi:hypothetical protein